MHARLDNPDDDSDFDDDDGEPLALGSSGLVLPLKADPGDVEALTGLKKRKLLRPPL